LSRRLDWGLVKARLVISGQEIENALHPTPERLARVYAERAVRLAKIPPSQARASEPVMIFRLGGERYSIALDRLVEVIPLRSATAVPGAPGYAARVINVRGEIRPLVDLKALLGIGSSDERNLGFALLLNKQSLGVGLQVDFVEGAGSYARQESQAVEVSRYVTCRTPEAGMLLSVDALLNTIEGAT
jgi:chemotaxis signal transduction protein